MFLYCEHPKSSTNCFEVTIKSQQPQSPPLRREAWKVDLPSSHCLSLSLAASPQTPPLSSEAWGVLSHDPFLLQVAPCGLFYQLPARVKVSQQLSKGELCRLPPGLLRTDW